MESQMSCSVSDTWSPKMPKGLDLEITHHPLSMKRVANLIIAMERFKGDMSESPISTEFRDEQLLDIMMDSFVEEQTVFECFATPTDQYNQVEEHQCSVTDSEKRSLVRVQDRMELHAVMLQGGSDSCKVHLNMSTYLPPTRSTEALPVALGIKDTNLYLSCHMDGDEPTLNLEEVNDKESLQRISTDSDMVRFLFYRHDKGLNHSTLVSVPFSKWYISTAADDNKPVEMCLENAERYRDFILQDSPAQEDQA